MRRKKVSGLTGVEVLVVLALLGSALFVAKPALFPGDSKRAAQSTAATARVEDANTALGSAASASVVKIGEANAAAPASPSRDFIAREVPVALSHLPAPDPVKLLEAERRRAAVMEGKLEEARKLYEGAAKSAERLQSERDAAQAARRNADVALEKAAAAAHARTMQALCALGISAVLLGAFVWVKLNGISATTLGKVAADIRSGVNPLQALDTYTPERLFSKVQRAAKLASDLK